RGMAAFLSMVPSGGGLEYSSTGRGMPMSFSEPPRRRGPRAMTALCHLGFMPRARPPRSDRINSPRS
ncbi:MAG: hypothetical protein ABR915_09370, partial [Thermoguttaceae bacterium]